MVIMSVYSTCHGLHLATVHAHGKWVNHFQHALELREGVGLFVAWNGAWSSDTYGWDDSRKRPITGINWNVSDIECNDILRCDC